AGVTVTNSGAIDINLSTVQTWGGAAIWAADRGGGLGGNSYGATVTNSGAITATLTGSLGAAGIQAISYGGYGGYSSTLIPQNNFGGSGGDASIVNSGTVDLTWTWRDAGSDNNGVYGLFAQSQGWSGFLDSAGNGGNGGDGGSATVTLTRGGDVSVTATNAPPSSSANSAGILAEVIGGDGGTGGGGDGNIGGNGGYTRGASQISV
ncbi:hypothetical protein AB4144_42240, partial [Rhizobiaceae sp. 2RAB30]